MPNPWFRLYSEFEDDPKVQMLSEAMQRRLVMLLCSRCKEVKLSEEQMAFKWRVSPGQVTETKETFLQQGFIDEKWNLLNWNKRQFLSDSSTDRVRRFRSSRALKHNETLQKQPHAVTVTAPDTDTDTDTEQKHTKKRPSANGKPSPEVIEIYTAYPRHVAPVPAYKAIAKALTATNSDAILGAIDRFKRELTSKGTEMQFIPHPATWFNDGRYKDEPTLELFKGNGKLAAPDPLAKMHFVNSGGAR